MIAATTASAIPEALRVVGIVAAAALAAAAVLAPSPRPRAVAMLGALVLTPVLLVGEIWNTPQLETVRDHAGPALVAAALGLVAVLALAWVMARWPTVLAALALGALPFRIPVEAGGSTANLLVPLYVVIAAGALAWLVPRLRAPDRFTPQRGNGVLEWLLVGLVVLYALQSAYSDDRSKALEQVVFFYVPFALLFAVLRDIDWTEERLHAGLLVLLGLALAFTAVGFWEYQARELLLNPKVIASNQVEEYFRVNSLFFDPNIYGRFLALVMIAVAGVLLWTRRKLEMYAAAAVLAVLWGGLLLTLSQSSFVALLAGLAILALLRFGWLVVAPIVVAGGLAAVILVVAFPSALRVDLGSSESLDKATSGRSDLIRGGVELGRERPVAGWGAGSFERQFRRHERTSIERAQSASHTIPITVFAEQGALGLAAYLALLVAALARLLRGASRAPARAVIAAGFVALVVHTWMYAAFLEDPVTWTLLGIGTALAATGPPLTVSRGPGTATAPEAPAPPVPAPAKT
jgi:O-antigen ligase